MNINSIDSFFSSEELFLIECLFRENKSDFDIEDIDEKKLLTFAQRNGLSQILYKNICSKKLSASAQQILKKKYLFNLGKNASYQLIAAELIKKLSEKNIQVIFLKGISLISEIYKDIGLRPMSDIDIMTTLSDFYVACKTIVPNVDKINFNDKTGHHFPCFNYYGFNIELHRTLFPTDVKYQIPLDEIWQETKKNDEFNALTICPLHKIIYLLLHIYYTYRQGGLRLLWFYDIKTLLNYYGDAITPENVEFTVKKWKIYKPVRKMLVFFTLIIPKNRLSIVLTKKEIKEAKKMINMLRYSDSMKLEYSYGIAWERFFYTKGLKNKWIFLKNKINSKQKFSLKRLYHLILNTVRLLWRKTGK